MKLLKISLKNIRSYTDETIIFPEGSLLISGDIGSGKTTILLAIEYALFGLQPGQKGALLLKNNAQSGGVVLDFEIGKKNVRIKRGLKRTLKGISNDYASVTIDGERFESSVTEIKSRIIDLLGYPSEFVRKNNALYKFTVHSPQEQMKQIILEDAESRINILRHIFGIDRYRQIKQNLLLWTNALKLESRFLSGEVSLLQQDTEKIQSLKSRLIILQGRISEKIKSLKEKRKNIVFLEKELKLLDESLKEKKDLESEIEKTKLLVSTKRELQNAVSLEIKELKSKLSEAGQRFSKETYDIISEKIIQKKSVLNEASALKFEILGKIGSLEKEQNSNFAKKERIFKIDICPTCLQTVSDTYKHNIVLETENQLSELKKRLSSLSLAYSETVKEVELKKKELLKLESEKLNLEILKSKVAELEFSHEKLLSLERRKNSIEEDIQMLLSHSDSIKERLLSKFSLEIKFRKKDSELFYAKSEEKSEEIEVATLSKEIELTSKDISETSKEIERKKQLKQKLHSVEEISDWLSSQFAALIDVIERSVLLRLRKEFAVLFRKWFLMLVPENSLETKIDDNFSPLILQGGIEMEYSHLSGGERTAVALAYRLALNQTINSFLSKIKTKGIIILDEPTDGFSDTQVDKIRDILEELNAEQLIIVSHEQKIESFVDNVLRIKKEDDSSGVQSAEQNQKA